MIYIPCAKLCRRSTPSIVCLIGTVLLWCKPAQADGAYGRIDGDMAAQIDAGAGVIGNRAVGLVTGTMRYLQTAGLYTTFAHQLKQPPRVRDSAPWSWSVGVELKPLFMPRFLSDLQSDTPVLDLFVDSFSMRFGLVTSHRGPMSQQPGFEAAIAIGLPLTKHATGPWISTSAAMRWSQHGMDSHDSAYGMWCLTIGWQSVFSAGIVDAGDSVMR